MACRTGCRPHPSPPTGAQALSAPPLVSVHALPPARPLHAAVPDFRPGSHARWPSHLRPPHRCRLPHPLLPRRHPIRCRPAPAPSGAITFGRRWTSTRSTTCSTGHGRMVQAPHRQRSAGSRLCSARSEGPLIRVRGGAVRGAVPLGDGACPIAAGVPVGAAATGLSAVVPSC